MGLTALNSALSGLAISQAQIDVISTNVANVGTVGYSRKTLPQSTQLIGGMGVGVNAENLIRQVDINLSRDLWTQVSATEISTVKENYLSRINEFHGPPDRDLSFAAKIGKLQDAFVALADDPESSLLLSQVVGKASDTADKINEYSRLITSLRNDAQDDMVTTVTRINNLLDQIVDLNTNISEGINFLRSTANAEDLRDAAVQELSGLIEISSFQSGNGILVVQTNRGTELVARQATHLTIKPSALAADVSYPDTAAGVYVGDPIKSPVGAVDITAMEVGGRLGGLIELRDEILPQQMAQLDELSHKMAMRFEAQGLMLFTDGNGGVPDDTPPDLTTDPVTAVSYVGFSAIIRVNQDILNDNLLLQTGTNGAAIKAGSNEVMSRVIENVFSQVSHEEAIGAIDMNSFVGTIQDYAGLESTNSVEGGVDLTGFSSAAAIIAAANGDLDSGTDTFRITFEEADLSLGPVNIDVELGAIADGAGNLTQDIIDHINTVIIPSLSAINQAELTAMNAEFVIGINGQLTIKSRGDITLNASSPANAMGADNLAILGLTEITSEAEDPYLDIQVGDNPIQRVYIEPSDTPADLLTKLQAVSGLGVQDFTTSADGYLRIRPGENYDNPLYGGELKIFSGNFTTASSGAGVATIPDGINVISALFGTFSGSQNVSPINSILYGSETSSTDGTLIEFRDRYLGAGGRISTEIIDGRSITDFAQKMINQQSQDLIRTRDRLEDRQTLQNLLQDRLLNESGVSLDEELGFLIVVQTAYAASARVINAIDESFQELLNALG